MSASDRLDWQRDGGDWPLREHSRFVTSGGLHWHVQDLACRVDASATSVLPVSPGSAASGSVPSTVLLLHGTGSASHSWRGLAPLLAHRMRVIAPDLPGHGFTSAAPPGEASPAGMARAVGRLLGTLGIEPTWVIGHSAGAAIALRMALDGVLDPARTSGGIASVNGALLPLHGPGWTWFSPAAKLLAAAPGIPQVVAWRAQSSALVDRLLDATGSQADETGRRLYARLVGSPAHVAGALQMMAQWDLPALRRDLPRLRADWPLHLVVGERDATVPARQAFQLQTIRPSARVSVLPGLGHLAHEEAPAAVLAALDAPR